jgi:uridine kinase
LIKVSQDDQKRKTLLQQVANQFHQEPYPKLVMLIEPNGSYKDSMIASRTDEIFSKPSRSIRAKNPAVPRF